MRWCRPRRRCGPEDQPESFRWRLCCILNAGRESSLLDELSELRCRVGRERIDAAGQCQVVQFQMKQVLVPEECGEEPRVAVRWSSNERGTVEQTIELLT